MNSFKNKVILITGGTGSFGRNFAEKIITFKPKKIIIFSRDEQKHNEMINSLPFKNSKIFRYFIGDVRDIDRLLLATKGVDIIIHTAAMKHVHLCEYNPIECVNTNILGAKNIVQASIINKVKKIISISTDKAVNPVNIYGASKLVSDKIFTAANYLSGNDKTIFSVTRYGNVIGSKGSILDLFKKLIKDKSPFLPVTDPNMTRFWITMDECVNFISKSINIMKGGEIFIPKIPAMRLDHFISHFAPNYPTKIVGIRDGEKIHETMISKDDNSLIFENKDMYIQCDSFAKERINANKKIGFIKIKPFNYTSNSANKKNDNEIKKILKKISNTF